MQPNPGVNIVPGGHSQAPVAVLQVPPVPGKQSASDMHPLGPVAKAGQVEVCVPLKIGLWSWMLPPCRDPDRWYASSGTWIEKTSVFWPPLSVTATAQLTSADVWFVLAVPQIKRVGVEMDGLHDDRFDGSGLVQEKYPVMVVQ